MIRVAAAGDVHYGSDSAGTLAPHIADLPGRADLLLLAGDLTRAGDPAEAAILAGELAGLSIPTVAVLGNHDYELDRPSEVGAVLRDAGVVVLEGDAVTLEAGGSSVGIAGTKGFGGGFADACGTDFGEPEMKAFIRHTQRLAGGLEAALRALTTDVRIALMHYAPVNETLRGERLEIYAFLGSYLLGEAVDRAGADLVLHGHAHGGKERGLTPGGVPVRNVAQAVIRQPFKIYCLAAAGGECGDEPAGEHLGLRAARR